MKTIFFILLALVLAGTVHATDSGIYFDLERGGEGISLHRDGDRVVAYLFTYGQAEQEVPVNLPPWVSPQVPLEDPLNGQRWFLMSDRLVDDSTMSGIVYQSGGINYPEKLHPNDIAAAVAVGNYELTRAGEGWELVIVPTSGSPLADDDPLFTVPFGFGTRLFISGD
jgi:hypothetical protein